MRNTIREEMRTLRRAERGTRRRKEQTRARARFIANPFRFASRFLGSKGSGKLKADNDFEKHLKNTNSNTRRKEE
jgi:hypothetical protein